jgi:uncharacterized protein (TIGR02246 family)
MRQGDAPMKRFIVTILFASGLIASSRVASSQNLPLSEEARIRDFIKVFADARNAHNGSSVATLYSEDGEWLGPAGTGALVRGREALTAMWNGVPGKVERKIQSIDFPSANIAVVRVGTEYTDISQHNEVFVIVQTNDEWRIKSIRPRTSFGTGENLGVWTLSSFMVKCKHAGI